MNDFIRRKYLQKLRSADQVARMVRSGDRIFFGEVVAMPDSLDEALADRAGELSDIILEGVCITRVPRFITADPNREHFIYNDWHLSGAGRKMFQQGLCSYIPFAYHQGPRIIRKYNQYDFVFITACPMDSQGYFNYGLCNSITSAVISKAKKIVVEVNDSIPHCLGGNHESVHISRVDYIVQGKNPPLMEIASGTPGETELQIARHVLGEIEDGSCLQLGIGGLPNVVGSLLAESDIKDLGIHTEMLVDSMVDLYNAGKVTGNCKTIDRFKMTYTLAMGTKKLYDFLDNNPACASYPVNYINDPKIIAVNNKAVAINSAIEVDLFGQVCSESVGPRQISGTGGQLDFIYGAFNSHGGKGIISLSSTYTDRAGKVHSRIVPTLRQGSIVTVPRSIVQYVATEYGVVQLKGKSTWERAEALVGIAHPQFRDGLIAQAEEMRIWLNRNRHDADNIAICS